LVAVAVAVVAVTEELLGLAAAAVRAVAAAVADRVLALGALAVQVTQEQAVTVLLVEPVR